jgi:hypothetical protein
MENTLFHIAAFLMCCDEPMILSGALLSPNGRHRCHNSGGSHVALQGELFERHAISCSNQQASYKGINPTCTKTIHRYRRAIDAAPWNGTCCSKTKRPTP